MSCSLGDDSCYQIDDCCRLGDKSWYQIDNSCSIGDDSCSQIDNRCSLGDDSCSQIDEIAHQSLSRSRRPCSPLSRPARQRDSCNLGGSSSRMTHFSAAKRRVRRVVRAILSRKVSERDAVPSVFDIWAMPEDGPPNGSGLPVGRGGAEFGRKRAEFGARIFLDREEGVFPFSSRKPAPRRRRLRSRRRRVATRWHSRRARRHGEE